MSFSYFIGLIFFICLAFGSIIAHLGWMRDSQKIEALEKKLEKAESELNKKDSEIASLESWLSIYKAQGGIDFDVDR